MAVIRSLALGLSLVAIGQPVNAFVAPSFAGTNALRQLDSKLSRPAAARLTSQAPQLARSSFAPATSCAATPGRLQQQSGSGGLSMKVINVGVIGAGRCMTAVLLCCLCMILIVCPARVCVPCLISQKTEKQTGLQDSLIRLCSVIYCCICDRVIGDL